MPLFTFGSLNDRHVQSSMSRESSAAVRFRSLDDRVRHEQRAGEESEWTENFGFGIQTSGFKLLLKKESELLGSCWGVGTLGKKHEMVGSWEGKRHFAFRRDGRGEFTNGMVRIPKNTEEYSITTTGAVFLGSSFNHHSITIQSPFNHHPIIKHHLVRPCLPKFPLSPCLSAHDALTSH